MPVHGIGTVEIPVKLKSPRNGSKHSTIHIKDVLHAPTATCNILGQGDFMDQYKVMLNFREKGKSFVKDKEGYVAAFFHEKKALFCLKLSGPPVGPVTEPSLFLDSDKLWSITVTWPDSERMF